MAPVDDGGLVAQVVDGKRDAVAGRVAVFQDDRVTVSAGCIAVRAGATQVGAVNVVRSEHVVTLPADVDLLALRSLV